jgi:hypothetical protein
MEPNARCVRREGGRRARVAIARAGLGGVCTVLLSIALVPGRAAAAVGSFSVAPSSGPPGTRITVSGTGCSPGLSVSHSQDYVSVSASTFGVDEHAFVDAAGSWSTTLVVPASAPAGPVSISAVCMTDGLPSLVTVYTPQTFTVTAASTTTGAPPTTKVATTSSNPRGGDAKSGDGSSVSSPGDPRSTPSTAKTNPAETSASGLRSRAADLRTPEVPTDVSGHVSSPFGWLWWLLVVGVLGGGITMWRLSRAQVRRNLVEGQGAS